MTIAPGTPEDASGLLLTISIVTYNPDLNELSRTLESLQTACAGIEASRLRLAIIDNSAEDTVSPLLARLGLVLPTVLRHGHGNIGFGRGHNLALDAVGAFHLVLNPDIDMDAAAIAQSLSFMADHPACGLITPRAVWPGGERQYLCKRYPALFDLLLRGFAPRAVRQSFDRRLARYEMRAETDNGVFIGPPIVSGCYMFFRGSLLKRLGGFDPAFLLYFEDFDLALRAGRQADIAYVPAVKVVHEGGHAARKGLWHIRQFARSAVLFYRKNGLKLF